MFRAILGLAALAALPLAAQPCDPSDAIKKFTGTAEQRLAEGKRLRAETPNDYFAHRLYQDGTMRNGVFPEDVQAEYRALRDAHPDDPLYATLYARALTGSRTPEAINVLNGVVALQSDYAYARLKLAEIYNAPAFRDEKKLRANLESYWKACPSSVSGYTMLARLDDADFVGAAAARLRSMVDSRSDADALTAYGTLWTLEFKTVPLAAQEPLRAQVRKDLARIRAAGLPPALGVYSVLSQGYKLVSDSENAKWADAEAAKLHPTSGSGFTAAFSKWMQENRPKPGASGFAEQREAMAKASEDWVRQFPDDPRAWGQRFSSLQMQQDAPQEQVVKAGEEWIRVYEQHPDPGAPQPYIQVAGFFANKNIRFDEIPALLEKGLKVPPPPDLMPATDLVVASARPLGMQLSNLYALSTAANAYIKIKQYDKAEAVLDKLGVALRGIKAPESGAERTPLASLESQYWDYLSKVARAQEHKIDALAFERMSITANPFPGMEEVRLRSLRDHWKELGGTDAGFDAWMKAAGSPTPAGTPPKSAQPGVANTMQPWSTMNKPMPEFVLSDADGRKWTLADLKGKVTLVNVWATWCEPCRNELPYIQKIFNKVRERKDIVVLTLNVDDNPGLIMPFLAQNHYTFPVVPAEGYVNRLIPQLSIPRNWIVDGAGAMRSERIGFGSGDDKWVDEMIASLEQARR